MNNVVLRKRTIAVLIITLLMMVAEIYFGIVTNSMGLTADGFHMGCHAFAFLVTLLICIIAIRYQNKESVLNAIGGSISAILLGFTALGIIYESIERFLNPQIISFEEAVFVAFIGLVVNVLCMLIMGGENPFHNHQHHEHEEHECHEEHGENLNFKAAYMHILADALTSVLAIVALLCGKYFGLNFLDPMIGITGGVIIGKWSINLTRTSFKVLF